MYIPIISGIIELGNTYIQGKNKKAQAKADAQATVMVKAAESDANWEAIMADNSGHSWKDEWLTILFSIPMVLAFFPVMVDDVQAGFAVLDSMPSWYQYTLSVIVAASFGVRTAIGWKNSVKR